MPRENNIPIRLMNEVVEVLSRASLLGPVATEGQDDLAVRLTDAGMEMSGE